MSILAAVGLRLTYLKLKISQLSMVFPVELVLLHLEA